MLLREELIGNMIPVIFIHKGYQPYLEFTLKKALDDKTAELKAMSGSSDMDKRKALTAEKYRIESAIEKLKKVKA